MITRGLPPNGPNCSPSRRNSSVRIIPAYAGQRQSARIGIEINACFDPDSSMNEFAKIASAIEMWSWGLAGMILATSLLFRHAVTFDQAVILILLNVVLDRLIYGKQPSPRPQNRSSAAMAENRRRPKLLQPIKGRPVGAGARIGYCAAPRTSSQKERKSPRVGRET
jgi:hypothetical protein